LSIDKSIDQYLNIIGQDAIEDIKELANRLKGTSVAHINSTKFGGGVAEILKNLIPLANSLGLKAEWQVIKGDTDFFRVTKSFHNALQGMPMQLTEEMKQTYMKVNREYANNLYLDHDMIFIHDPQPLALIDFIERKNRRCVWRCHIDLTNANVAYWNFIRQFAIKYDGLVFSLDRYVRDDVRSNKIFVISPSIDPLSEKNKPMSLDDVLDVLNRFDIDPEKPIVSQVARFDYWKDPIGVIKCHRLIRKRVPTAQVLLVGSMAKDDPEGEEWYQKTVKEASHVEDVFVLTDRDDVGDREVNAFQRASNVVIQKSIREGFGLSVTEALWKGTPVVATRAGGIPLQVIDGVTGFLVKGIEDTAERTVLLLKRRYVAKMLGIEGKEHVQRNFLITRHLRDYMKVHLELAEPKSPAATSVSPY
jgi:trehalose synthase